MPRYKLTTSVSPYPELGTVPMSKLLQRKYCLTVYKYSFNFNFRAANQNV